MATDPPSHSSAAPLEAFATPAARAVGEVPSSADLDRLMDRYAAGDGAAFAELHRQLAPRLRAFLVRICGEPRLADDLLQDAFLRVHRARGTFSPGAAVVPWAYAIARNVHVDHARRGQEQRTGSLEDLRDGIELAAPTGASPEADVVANETLAIVRATMAALPPAHREAFILIRYEGLSVAEAAQVLDASEANVKVRAFRAYEAFRQALKRSSEGNDDK
jgi:RNA polymerase sigma-70 factor, ECF subfamily